MSQTKNEFLDLSKYKKEAKIGQGSFGIVFKVTETSTGEIFAAKISILEIEEDQKSLILNLMREVNIISQLNHPSILKFIGYSPVDFDDMSKPVIITEYSSNGSLESIIELERKSLSPKSWDDTKKLINIYGIALAMSYLHSHDIVHRDLKAANILEDDYLFPKIADFGLSKKFHHNQDSMSFQSTAGAKGTPIYMAPEIWESNEYTKAGDVYAFSFIVYEILTLEQPFKDLTIMQFLAKVIHEGYRPEFKYKIPDCYHDLITRCWSKNPEERPTFDYIVDLLKNNEEFITDGVDRDEFYDYVDLVDNYSISFDPSKKFKKITISKEPSKVIEKVELNSEMPIIYDQIKDINEFNNLPNETREYFRNYLQKKSKNCKEIVIQFNEVEFLYTKKLLNSTYLIKVLQFFNEIELEINYPSACFDQIFSTVSYLATNVLKTVSFHYYVSDTKDIHRLLGTKNIPIPFDIQLSLSTTDQKQIQLSSNPSIRMTLESSVNSIGDFQFNGCTRLTQITIPSSVTSIGKHSFNSCFSLKQITIPTSVTSIKSCAFYGCSSLERINIPSSVTSIESSAFSNCSSLKEIIIPSSNKSIEDSLFRGCSSLIKIEIPSSINSIGNWSFAQCSSLIEITIPSSVNSIGDSAFYECKALNAIEIPSSVNSIGKAVFHKCSSLKKFEIPSSVSIINEKMFNECKSLVDVKIPSSVNIIGESAFDECFSLENLIIPSSVNSINEFAFRECKSLVEIRIPSSVISIKKQAFANCSKLKDVVFENNSSLKSIGDDAFGFCVSLTKMTVPSFVKEIGKEVFKGCSALKELCVPSVIYKFLFLSPSFVKNFLVAKYLGIDQKTKLTIK